MVGILLVQSGRAQVGDRAKKLPVPEAAKAKEALGLVREVFEEEYEAAKTNQQKAAFAKKLLQEGTAGEHDPISRYALLRVARDLAAIAGDAETAVKAIGQLDRRYRVDALAMKAAVFAKVADKLRQPADHKKILPLLGAAFDEAVAADRFDIARQIGNLATTSANKTRDPIAKNSVDRKLKKLKRLEADYAQVKDALAVLETKPTDPQANLTVGKYRCFLRGDWENGLSNLALGSDAALKKVAEQEIVLPASGDDAEGPAPPQARADLGNAWWDLADAAAGIEQSAMYARAAYHYRQAAPHMSGLAGMRLKARLKDLASKDPDALIAARRMAGEKVEVAAVDGPRPKPKPKVVQPQLVRRTVTIPANSEKGFVIGPVKKGTKLGLQYVSGKWKGWGSIPDICPDKTDGRGGSTCLLAVVAFTRDGRAQRLTLVPQGTKQKPFIFEIPQDVEQLVLRINGRDNKWRGNPGKVVYNVAVQAP